MRGICSLKTIDDNRFESDKVVKVLPNDLCIAIKEQNNASNIAK